MSTQQKYHESMLFNYETTSRTDYCNGDIKPQSRTIYKPKPTCLRIRPPPLKDYHTLTDRKSGSYLPTDLFLKPKDIIRKNPKTIQQRYEKPEDTNRDTVQQTKPRLVMTPAVSMDDIVEPEFAFFLPIFTDGRAPVTELAGVVTTALPNKLSAKWFSTIVFRLGGPVVSGTEAEHFRPQEWKRALLLNDIYTTTAMKMDQQVVKTESFRAPFPGTPAPANPIMLRKLQVPYVSPEWLMESVSWDKKQLRTHCDPSRQFYINRRSKMIKKH